MNESKNALIFACGGKLGKSISQTLTNRGFTVYGASSTIQNINTLSVDWHHCFINHFEKFLGQLPKLDLVIFNQNSNALTNDVYGLGSTSILNIWKQSKQWMQSHYVNNILPVHVLHSMANLNIIDQHSKIVWILSRSMFNTYPSPVDYVGQKYQNYVTLQKLAKHNPQTFLGVCPGQLTDEVYDTRSHCLIDLVTAPDIINGAFYEFDQPAQNFKLFNNQEIIK
jgi:GDP-D-mannose dehydratase